MSDARRVYRRIKTSLRQLYPKQLNGHQVRHLDTLTGMITGMISSFWAMVNSMVCNSKLKLRPMAGLMLVAPLTIGGSVKMKPGFNSTNYLFKPVTRLSYRMSCSPNKPTDRSWLCFGGTLIITSQSIWSLTLSWRQKRSIGIVNAFGLKPFSLTRKVAVFNSPRTTFLIHPAWLG